MNIILRTLLALTVTGAIAACAPPGEQPAADGAAAAITVKGALAYRERIALPPAATANITVSDISIADRKAPLIAEQSIDLGSRQVPIDFELVLAKAKLKPRARYSLRGSISGPNGQLMWATDTAHIIDPSKPVNDLGTLTLVRASQKNKSSTPALQGHTWVVENIAGGGVIDAAHATLNFGTGGKLFGLASCNNYSGTYELTGEELSVGMLAVTQMACAPALNQQERRFLQVLQSARSFAIDTTGKLIIHAESGTTLEAYSSDSMSN